jgi:hypothetical protein
MATSAALSVLKVKSVCSACLKTLSNRHLPFTARPSSSSSSLFVCRLVHSTATARHSHHHLSLSLSSSDLLSANKQHLHSVAIFLVIFSLFVRLLVIVAPFHLHFRFSSISSQVVKTLFGGKQCVATEHNSPGDFRPSLKFTLYQSHRSSSALIHTLQD